MKIFKKSDLKEHTSFFGKLKPKDLFLNKSGTEHPKMVDIALKNGVSLCYLGKNKYKVVSVGFWDRYLLDDIKKPLT